MRLFCFPYAGGSAGLTVFREWATELREAVEVLALETPGRGRRYGEPLIGDLHELTARLRSEIAPLLDLPCVFFGHSVGALVSFELCRALQVDGKPLPELLIASGKRAPHLPHAHRLHLLPDPQLIEALKQYNGTPDDVLKNSELMELFLPVLRADFSLAETYVHQRSAPLPLPIHALGGVEDGGVERESLEAWREHSADGFVCEMFAGDHFFLQGEARAAVRERICALVRARSSVATELPA
jgi:medium-chain acyl-[acyl-carrier-protein] hydrolase